jgi:Arc-like DNA binding domain
VAKKPTDTVQLKLRFPEALRRQLVRAAADHNQSLNSEIVGRLYGSFRSEGDRAEVIAKYLFSVLQEDGVLDRMIEMDKEAEAEMAAYDEWKERAR